MADWIKIEHTLPGKPEVSELAELLTISESEVMGRLLLLWIWSDQHSADGHAVSVTQTTLDRRVGLEGFAAALRKVGWLEGRDGALTFPRFDRHNGQSAKSRAQAKDRKEIQRSRDRHADTVTKTGLEGEGDKRRGDTEGGEGETLAASKAAPAALRTPSPHSEDGEIPSAKTVESFGAGSGVPPDYCQRYHAKTHERRAWLNGHGRLIDWRKQIVRFWNEDRPTWGKGSPTSPKGRGVNINQQDHKPY